MFFNYFFACSRDHRDLNLLTHSVPTRRTSDLLVSAAFSPLLGIEDDMTNRAVRLIELFEASGQIDAARLKAIKYDTAYSRSGYAKAWEIGRHTSELQSLMRISYAVFSLTKKSKDRG